MEELLIAFGVFVVITVMIFIIYVIDKKKKKNKEIEKHAIEKLNKAFELEAQKEKLIRQNMLRRYEEKKQEGLAELDKWCRQYNMTIHQMEVFLGLVAGNTEIIKKLQDIENGIYAPRVGVAVGF